MDDHRDDSKDFMPEQDDWDLKSMPSLTSDEEVHDISYLFDDSVRPNRSMKVRSSLSIRARAL